MKIDYKEFAPVNDTFVVKVVPDKAKKETDSGIIIAVTESKVHDRPTFGQIVSVGPDTKYKIGYVVFFPPTSGFDLEMIETKDEEKFLLIHDDAVLGIKVSK